MKISFDELKARNILSKGQMQNVKGGGTGTCGYVGPLVEGKRSVLCDIPKAEALFMYADGGEGMNWCCDSCKDTWYCGEN